MAEGLNLQNTQVNLGWEPSPLLQQSNKEAEEIHQRVSAPLVQTVMSAAAPTATPEDRLKAAKVFETSNEARIGDAIGAIVNLNPRDLYIALTGGASVKEPGYDGAGNSYEVIYNQRGELRGYRDITTGKELTPEDLTKTGPITTRRDVTAERTSSFKAMGATLQDVAKARAADLVTTLNAAREAGANGGLIQELGAKNDEIAKRLSPASMDTNTLAFIRGISNIRTGDTQATRSMIDKVKEGQSGNKSSKDFTDNEKKSIGLNLGLQYHEGKGWVNSKGEVQSSNDIDRLARQFEESQSSDKAIQTRQQDMLARAQTLFAGKVERLDDITALINNNAKIAAAQNAIEQHGGISVAKPNLPHELGNSFMSARQKAVSDEYYGAASQLFYQFVRDRTANLRPGQSPDIGMLRAEFANSDEMKNLRRAAAEKSKIVDVENNEVAKQVNARSQMQGLTNETARTPVQPPSEAMPTRTTPAGSRAPVVRPTTESGAAPQRRSLANIFGG
jgi:hypothetical protein